MVPIQIRVTRKILEEIEGVIRSGRYSSRSEFVREALRSHLNKG
jgi:Arc/MetJ-type ribon-helix-helix transcriptional regulator